MSQSYSGQLEQTFKFPLDDEEGLATLCEHNRLLTQRWLGALGSSQNQEKFGPIWRDISAEAVTTFLSSFQVDARATGLSPELIASWIERQSMIGDLVNWTIVVRGREESNPQLGAANWLPTTSSPSVWNLGRTRIRGTNSLGVITNPGDEALGLSEEELAVMKRILDTGQEKNRNRAARRARSPKCGLLLLYPISRHSGRDELAPGRELLYGDSRGPLARDLIGLAVSFPYSTRAQPVQTYLEGSARWRPVVP